MSRLYDVAVVGAGPGGSAAAYYLGRMGLQVLLLDKAIFPRDKICGDALTPRGVVMLDAIGLLAQVAAVGQRVDNYQLFGPGRAYLSSSLATASNRPAYALVVPRLQLDNLLWQHAIARGVEFENAKALNITATPRYAVVEAEQNGRKVSWQARIVIVATGASYKLLQNSQLLKQPPHMMRAARTYYENLTAPAALQMYFRSVTLPGYGWVFPVGPPSPCDQFSTAL